VDIDPGELARAIGREAGDYTVQAIDPQLRIHSATGGVYRVRGDRFSLVIKIVRHGSDDDPNGMWLSGAEPEHRNYWKREWLAYSTGFLDSLPGELRAPRTLLTTEPAADQGWVWMEDVEGHPGAKWEPDDYDSVAFDLATTQAAFVSGRSVLPDYEWLARRWLRGWVETVGHQIATLDDDALWADDALADLAPLRPRVKALWASRETLLQVVETAPQTIVHCDFWPTNLIAADDGTTVAVDWSQVGIGAVAQDLDQMVLDPVWMQVTPNGPIAELESHVLRGYLSGLRSSGVDLGDSAVRRWYAAAASLRYAPLLAAAASSGADPRRLEERFNRPYAVIARDRARVVAHALDLGEALLDGG
jgi:hypothetical protein